MAQAIYCFELAFHTLFSVATGVCRLDYNAFENRAFFLSLFRHATNVAARGCWRTAFEFNKLLLSLSPDEDPLSAILSIDFYALRACEFEWVKQLVSACILAWQPPTLLGQNTRSPSPRLVRKSDIFHGGGTSLSAWLVHSMWRIP